MKFARSKQEVWACAAILIIFLMFAAVFIDEMVSYQLSELNDITWEEMNDGGFLPKQR